MLVLLIIIWKNKLCFNYMLNCALFCHDKLKKRENKIKEHSSGGFKKENWSHSAFTSKHTVKG